jgi:hypothetical protein
VDDPLVPVHAATPTAPAVANGAVSAVSWGAIFAGVAVAAATSLLLFALATGLDLAAMSRAAAHNGPPPSQAVMAGVALIVTQWVSACLGGYITGRLRTRWVGTHTHEVFFRDTAHGFITWCVATLLIASGLASSAAALPGLRLPVAGSRAHDAPARVLVPGDTRASAQRYSADAQDVDAQDFADTPYPQFTVADSPAARRAMTPPAEEGPGTLVLPPGTAVLPGGPPVIERGAWLGERSTPGPARALDESGIGSGDAARHEAAVGAILTALSMLVGAFVASVAAALGGRRRDLHP